MKIIKNILSIVSCISSIVISIIALFMPPVGIIDTSVLWFTAQLLLFTSSILGIDFPFSEVFKKNNKNI